MSTPTGNQYGQELHPPAAPRADVVSLNEYLKVLLHWWIVVLGCTLVGILLGCLAFVVTPRTYQAQVTVALQPLADREGTGSVRASEVTSNEINSYAKAPDALAMAQDTLAKSYPDYAQMRPNKLLGKASYKTPETNALAITITFKAGKPEEAAAGANALADAYLTYRTQKIKEFVDQKRQQVQQDKLKAQEEVSRLNESIAALPANSPKRTSQTLERTNTSNQIDDLNKQLSTINQLPTNPGVLNGRALPPSGPSFPQLPVFAMGGLVVGLLAGVGLAFRREAKDDTVRGMRDVNRSGTGPVLATVRVPRKLPSGAGMALLTAPTSTEAEGYRLFAAKLQAPHLQVGGRLLFTGSYGGDTRVPFNVAVALSRMGRRVLLMAAPSALMETFGPLGLTESALFGVGYHGDHVGVALAGLPNLQLAPLRDDDMPVTNQLIQRAGDRVDYVLIDDASSPAAWRTLALSTEVDGVYIISMLGRNGRRSLKRLAEELSSVRARIMGSVLLLGSRVPAPAATMKGAVNLTPARPASSPTPHPASSSAPSAQEEHTMAVAAVRLEAPAATGGANSSPRNAAHGGAPPGPAPVSTSSQAGLGAGQGASPGAGRPEATRPGSASASWSPPAWSAAHNGRTDVTPPGAQARPPLAMPAPDSSPGFQATASTSWPAQPVHPLASTGWGQDLAADSSSSHAPTATAIAPSPAEAFPTQAAPSPWERHPLSGNASAERSPQAPDYLQGPLTRGWQATPHRPEQTE